MHDLCSAVNIFWNKGQFIGLSEHRVASSMVGYEAEQSVASSVVGCAESD